MEQIPHQYSTTWDQAGMYLQYRDEWSVSKPDDVSVTFEVSAPRGGVHIVLSPRRDVRSCTDCFEIIIGAARNKFIDINNGTGGANSYDTRYIYPLYNGDPTGKDFRKFWINLKDGEIAVGFGEYVYRNLIAAARQDAWVKYLGYGRQPMYWPEGIQFVSFSSWDEPVQFRNIQVGPAYVPRSSQKHLSRPFAVKASNFLYEQFNQPFTYGVSSTEFSLVFEAQVLSTLLVGFLPDTEFYSAAANSYEFIVGDGMEGDMVARYGTGDGKPILCRKNDLGPELLSPSKFTSFWISLKDGNLAMGEGRKVGTDQFMVAHNVPKTGEEKLFIGFASTFLANAVRVLAVTSSSQTLFDVRDDDSLPEDDKNSAPAVSMSSGIDLPYIPFEAPKSAGYCARTETCVDPLKPYTSMMPGVLPRYQWWFNGAYCGELSVQSVALNYGVYLSQSRVRRYATSYHDPAYFHSWKGHEVLHHNMLGTLNRLGFNAYEFDSKHTRHPQGRAFLRWVKKQLSANRPVIWMVLNGAGPMYDHVESVFGYQSDHPLTDPEVYPDDIIALHSGYDLNRYYRRADSLIDENPVATRNSWGNNCTVGEHVDCVDYRDSYGFSVDGLIDPLGLFIPTRLTVSDGGCEPPPPTIYPIHATVEVKGPLLHGQAYTIYRFNHPKDLPHNSKVVTANWFSKYDFTAKGFTHTWQDPVAFDTDSSIYYVTVKA